MERSGKRARKTRDTIAKGVTELSGELLKRIPSCFHSSAASVLTIAVLNSEINVLVACKMLYREWLLCYMQQDVVFRLLYVTSVTSRTTTTHMVSRDSI